MRALLLLSLLAITGCQFSVPRGMTVPVHARGQVRVVVPASVHVQTNVNVHVQSNVQVQAQVQAPPPVQVVVQEAPPPPPPAPPVAVQGATVVEFFGIPLEGAQDVIFVLDVSGSMEDAVQGQLAQVAAAPAAAAPAPPPAAPVDPNAPPPPPPDPNAPPAVDPNAQPAAPPPPPAPPARRKIDVAQSELLDALSKLPAGTRINVVFFNSNVDAVAPTIFTLEESNRTSIEDAVKETTADGRTALAPAMRVAFLLNAKRIILLSDGLGNVNGNSDDVLRDAREAIRSGIRIDAIGIGVDQDRQLLGTLAGESGGLYQSF